MGLDICVYKMVKFPSIKKCNDIDKIEKLDTSKEYTSEDIKKMFSDDYIYQDPVILDDDIFNIYKNIIPKGYIFNYKHREYDYEKFFNDKGINFKDYELYGQDFLENEYVVIFVNKKDESKTIEFVDNFSKDFKYFKYVTRKAFMREEKEYAHMRKGANDQFYKDDMWDKYIYVFNKKTLEQHMIKYFDEKSDGRYDNPRQKFKEEIYDKFKDKCGMYVCYC